MEMAIVLAVSGLMFNFVLSTVQAGGKMHAGCVAETKKKLETVRAHVERFARNKDRLPLPAARNIASDNINYGRESSGANIDAAGGVSFGALPWQALGLTSDYAVDCWGNKLTYAVTTALTTNASSGGYLDSSIVGGITLRKASATNVNTAIAYAVISHGEDGRGAVKMNWTAANPNHGWCTGSTNISYTNCLANAAVVMDAPFNNGKDAGANYFDDLVVVGGRPQVIEDVRSNAFCWGNNNYRQLGNGLTASNYSTPQRIKGILKFVKLAANYNRTCGITNDGYLYCWGSTLDSSGNNYGNLLGLGTTTSATLPTQVTYLASPSVRFKAIALGEEGSCALSTTGAAYCWGYIAGGQYSGASPWSKDTPQAVLGGHTFESISVGWSDACAVKSSGEARCWARSNNMTPYAIGGYTFREVKVSAYHKCGLTYTDDLYCWGWNGAPGELGGTTFSAPCYSSTLFGNTRYFCPSPRLVPGGYKFKKFGVSPYQTCGITVAGDAYCWGKRTALTGGGTSSTPELLAGKWHSIDGAGSDGMCGIRTNAAAYCWGTGYVGQLGGGGTIGEYSETSYQTTVSATTASYLTSTAIGSLGLYPGRGTACAVQPIAASWGANAVGQVGDDTFTDRTTPVYVKIPNGVVHYKLVSGYGSTKCALSDSGRVYCWGSNTCGQLGNGDRTDQKSPVSVGLPSGVTSFKSVYVGGRNACAIGNDNKPYCWGHADVCSATQSGSTPTLMTITPGTATSIHMAADGGTILGSDSQVYPFDDRLAVGSAWTMPGGVTSAKAAVRWGSNACMIGNNDQLYCSGVSDTYSAVGDGSSSGSVATLTQITPPAPATSFKAVSMSDGGGGYPFTCAIGSNDLVYCWGYQGSNYSKIGNGATGSTSYSPTAPTLPTGVSGFKTVDVGQGIVIALGDDGVTYYWGDLWTDNASASGYTGASTPTKLPLSIGASGYFTVSAAGRIATTF